MGYIIGDSYVTGAGRDESESGQRKKPGAGGEERGQSRGNVSIASWADAMQGGNQNRLRAGLPLACPLPSAPALGDPASPLWAPLVPDDYKTPPITFDQTPLLLN